MRVEGPKGELPASAPGDTLRYSVSGPAVTGATSYVWSVTGTPGTWGGLPVGLVTTGPSVSFAAIAPAGWDSVTFVVTFQGKSPARSSNVLTATWKVRRTLIAVGPLTVDSSGVGPISLLVQPGHAEFVVGDGVQLCAFWGFGSGHVAMRTVDQPTCGTVYAASFTIAQRSVSNPEQGYVDGLCDWPACLLGVTPLVPRTPADMVRIG